MENKKERLEEFLENSLEAEEKMMRTYLDTADGIQGDEELKNRLENFAEGNARRSKQLMDELEERKGQ